MGSTSPRPFELSEKILARGHIQSTVAQPPIPRLSNHPEQVLETTRTLRLDQLLEFGELLRTDGSSAIPENGVAAPCGG